MTEQLRTFHLSGHTPDNSQPAGALRPTILDRLKGIPDFEASFPLCVHPDGGARPFREVVNELEHAGNITCAFRTALNGDRFKPLDSVVESAINTLVECSPGELNRLRKLLPSGAYLVDYTADLVVLLHAASMAQARRDQRAEFWNHAAQAAARLREILLLDDTHASGPASAEAVSASLGARAASFFKPGALADALQRPVSPLKRMDSERRSRCVTTLAILEEALEEAAHQPAFWLFHSGIFGSTNPPSEVIAFHGEARFAVDSFAAALQFCSTRLDRLTQLLRALRVAALEADANFDPSIHEEMLARFDWQAASAAELNALPSVVVIEKADYFGQASLNSFGKLLRSGLPVQVLIVRAGLEPGDLTEYSPDFGYLAIAHRECFVLQSSMAQLSHLLPGLAAMVKTLRPAVAVVSGGSSSAAGPDAWLEESLLILSRTLPLFAYDPEAGPRWADRFRLLAVPAEMGDLTTVHAAAVSPALRRHFFLVTADTWNSDQLELNAYLDAYTQRPPLAIPYIWVENANGRQQRALVTRDLVNYCVDRRRAWALFEELADLGKPPVSSTAENPDQVRQEGAKEAIQRVLAMLTAA